MNLTEEGDDAARLTLLRAADEMKRTIFIKDGVLSKTYLALMELFRAKIPENIFEQIEILNQKAIAAYVDGFLRKGESLSVREERRGKVLRELAEALRDLREMSLEAEK